jgi:hypothetical protein
MTSALRQHRYALPKRQPSTQKLQELVTYLAYLAKSDGKLEAKPSGDKRARGADGNAIPKGKAMAAVVERKHKPSSGYRGRPPTPPPAAARTQASIQCHKCRGWGHKANVCPSATQMTPAQRLQVNAAAALKNEPADRE